MNTQPTANVINIEKNISKRIVGAAEAMPLITLSHAELRQLLSTQLQSSLDIKDILAMFFKTTQRLISYDSLVYKHAGHAVAAELGTSKKHSVTYNLNYQGEYLGDISFTRENIFVEDELGDFESIIASLIFPLRNSLLYTAALQSALKDSLTGIGNRIAMQQTLQRDIYTAQRHEQALSVLMIDIDFFKSINDTYGHSAGDAVLEHVAQHIQTQLRTADAVFRFGGEEFLAVLPNTCSQHANLVAERLRESLENFQINHEEHVITVTASIGCATLRSEDTQQTLLQRSDTALYAAKNNGRNQVQLAI
ncbi:GGDEF domain-containing protein [Pseudomonas sp. C27(2019)]|uniref:GGDEF domain-containing protein n=1 Tax=Pseudomonas sp. C27(2019) TaxID=2604941 RepID=UPI001244B695|nr:GGDEF domain-containing protein [Pseudomonas sp. C27(2019)]QEY58676.1 GGDEF domain-containing protein [Pseudomonas sp. C27(2019)]